MNLLLYLHPIESLMFSYRSYSKFRPLTIALATDSRALQRQQSFYQQGKDPFNLKRPEYFVNIKTNEYNEQKLRQPNYSILSYSTRYVSFV